MSPRSSRAMTALKAPRSLNEFESCSDSSFSQTRAAARFDSHADSTSGVPRTNGTIRFRARNASIMVLTVVGAGHKAQPRIPAYWTVYADRLRVPSTPAPTAALIDALAQYDTDPGRRCC